jgi:2-oxoglutarate dehydrogenase E2 component (dihydrolipoamide succinyltransferase)
MLEIKVPSVGESISEVQIGQWLVNEGDWVKKDQNIVDLETEKAAVQVSAPESGFVRNFRKQVEEFANVGDVLCELEPAESSGQGSEDEHSGDREASEKVSANRDSQADSGSSRGSSPDSHSTDGRSRDEPRVMPAARRLMEEKGLSTEDITPSGPGGRILKGDVLVAEKRSPSTASKSEARSGASQLSQPSTGSLTISEAGSSGRMEEVKPLSMIRRTIANRLVEAQQTAALLTTFNEVNMKPIMDLRSKYRDAFQQRHGVKLGFMSFFAKASVEALRRFPSVNAEIRGNNVVYRNYMDIGIAIGGGKGLVVPVLRNVELMSFAEVERSIGDFASKAMENRLMPEDLTGGTFTISNGGVYGSMLSTPIVNPPQSGILGLHAIQERPMAVGGQVVILPMMYLALTYDHRIIDGREAVTFLRTIKEICEDPTRLFLEV